MSKFQLKSVLQSEIQKLNTIIDLKIVRGESYRRESLRHKKLLGEMRRLSRSEWFGKAFAYMHLF